MDENSAFNDSWAAARLGNAIDVLVDRIAYGPQRIYDHQQAYGMSDDGRIYTIGQTDMQATATVAPVQPATIAGIPVSWLLIGAVIYLATQGGK